MRAHTSLYKGGRIVFFLLFLIFSISGVFLFSQENEYSLSITPFFDTVYTSNLYWDYEEVADQVFVPGFTLDIASDRINMYFTGIYRLYKENSQLNSQMLETGFEYFIPLGSRSYAFFSGMFSSNFYTDDMNYLNKSSPGAIFGIKKYLTKTFLLRAGIRAFYDKYYNYNPYDHYKSGLFIEANKFFKTQTTLRLTGGINYIYFPHLISDEITYYKEIIHPRGRKSSSIEVPVTIYETYEVDVPQTFFTFRIAQGLSTKTGLIFEIHGRMNYEDMENLSTFVDEEWVLERMNDDFFWEGIRISSALKTIAILESTISLELTYIDKTYNGIYARDLVGEVILPGEWRKDSLYQMKFLFQKRIKNLKAYINVILRKNTSNDPYFDYTLFAISGGVDYTF